MTFFFHDGQFFSFFQAEFFPYVGRYYHLSFGTDCYGLHGLLVRRCKVNNFLSTLLYSFFQDIFKLIKVLKQNTRQ